MLGQFGAERRSKFGLDGFKEALASLGNPEKSVHTIVIGGTNGKGTTALLLSATLTEAGFNVGTYLSPHLQSPNERILDRMKPVDENMLHSLGLEILPTALKFKLSYFEFMTLLCFYWAHKKKMDLLILEVGLGGRLDATNVTDPLASAITQIDLDHQDILGSTKEDILSEKMGIINSEGLFFTAEKDTNLLKIMENRCTELDTIYYYSTEILAEQQAYDWTSQRVMLNEIPFTLTSPTLGMLESARLAFLMIRIVFPKISIATIQKAFANTVNPGRFETVSLNPRVILSGDHNLAGLDCLEEALDRMSPKSRVITLCAFSPDKPREEMYKRLKSLSSILYTTKAKPEHPAPTNSAQVLGEWIEDPIAAIKKVISEAKENDLVLITGSLYLVGSVRSLWRKKVSFLKDEPITLT